MLQNIYFTFRWLKKKYECNYKIIFKNIINYSRAIDNTNYSVNPLANGALTLWWFRRSRAADGFSPDNQLPTVQQYCVRAECTNCYDASVLGPRRLWCTYTLRCISSRRCHWILLRLDIYQHNCEIIKMLIFLSPLWFCDKNHYLIFVYRFQRADCKFNTEYRWISSYNLKPEYFIQIM